MFLNTFYTYRTQPLTISAILAQILALPLGKFMAAILPTRKMHVPFIGWEYSLNPGPFNMKEHVLITIFANNAVSSGGGDAYSIGAINVMKAYYKQNLSFIVALIIVLTTQASSHISFCFMFWLTYVAFRIFDIVDMPEYKVFIKYRTDFWYLNMTCRMLDIID